MDLEDHATPNEDDFVRPSKSKATAKKQTTDVSQVRIESLLQTSQERHNRAIELRFAQHQVNAMKVE